MDLNSSEFGLLLKPINDLTTTNWGVLLAPFLDKYINYLHNNGVILNFPQAALLLQNSTHFYCKRVDMLFKQIEQLVLMIRNNKANAQEENDEEHAQLNRKERKKVKSLESEDLEVLDFVCTNYNINMNWNKVKLHTEDDLKCSFLNNTIKVPTKSNTSTMIYQINGTELGLKNEFRLQWYLFSDGTLNEDFAFESQTKVTFSSADDGFNASHDDNDFDNEVRDASEMDIHPEPELPEIPPSCEPTLNLPQQPERIISPVPLPEAIHTMTLRERRSPIKDAWATIVSPSLCPIYKIKLRKVFKLPKDLIVEGQEIRRKKINDFSVPCISYHCLLVNGNVDNLVTNLYNINEEKKKRKLLKLKNRLNNAKEAEKLESDAMGPLNESGDMQDCEVNGFEVDDDHYVDDNEGPNRDVLSLAERHDMLEQAIEDGYRSANNAILSKFTKAKKEYALRATEVAKRVAEWHESIMPALEASERRSHFDMNEYGTKILERFPDEDVTSFRPFGEIVAGQPKEEICRYFLSTLLLANTYSLEIRNSDPSELASDCLEMRLITKTRHHEELDANLQATSSNGLPSKRISHSEARPKKIKRK
ncbi:condensin-2 complex subunit H2 [Cimex lectularius]|uniref:Condensin-2 complex subunit H2 n=1 Tax=Cimex lectularius TaxID=79782 RepID=A0A8I6S5N3_CIMLE|nr:condensin-2 complex subunit H2 [Cimex lectularius]